MPREKLLPFTPLFALDAIVLDTETTGLDPAKARLIEIGAVRLAGARVQAEPAFQTLLSIGEPVPPASTAVHGLDDAALSGAPVFAAMVEALETTLAGHALIGHSIGFDLAVLKREYARIGRTWSAPASLDTRLLAQIVRPDLAAGHTLEALAAWLGLGVTDRHRAVGDARLTAEIFLALVPHLRERGIRTLGEAHAACTGLTNALADHARAGWEEPGAGAMGLGLEGLARIDSYPYRHRVRDIMSAPPVLVPRGTLLRDVLALLMERRISSVFVGEPLVPSNAAGIVTERDILRAVANHGADALALPVERVMSSPVAAIYADAFLYRAIGRMSARRVRHLATVDEEHRIIGALSARDLLRLRAGEALSLGDDIDTAQGVPELGRAWAKLPAMARALVNEDVPARDIAGVIARELGALTRRAAQLAEAELEAEGAGGPPCSYAVLVLGSAGRGESLLAMDQDNAIIFAQGEPDGAEDRWFARLGKRMTDILHAVGVPHCPGGVMASEPAFRGSLATWRARVATWLDRARPQDLLNVDIFYDFRPVHGDGALAGALWRAAWQAARGRTGFLKLLAEANRSGDNPFGLMGGLRFEDGRIDLKRHGLRAAVSGARVLAMRAGLDLRATAERLEGLVAMAQAGVRKDLTAIDAAHQRVLDLILLAQLADIAAGRPPSNKVPASIVDARRGRAVLKADLGQLSVMDEIVREGLSSAPLE